MIEFFRHCPGCGRRFHIKLVEKDKLDSYDTESKGPILPVKSGRVGGRGVGYRLAGMKEGPTMYFDVKEFAYHYKCTHCGHEWTENRLKEIPERAVEQREPTSADVEQEAREYARE